LGAACSEATASLVFLIELLSDRNHLTALGVRDPDCPPAFRGADHGAEHQFQHRLLAEGVGNDLEPPYQLLKRGVTDGLLSSLAGPGDQPARARRLKSGSALVVMVRI